MEEKITWSYGSVFSVHLYWLGAELLDHGLVGTDKLIVSVIQCTFSLPEMISESSEFEVGSGSGVTLNLGARRSFILLD